jgi:hypothetical protein
VPKQFEDDYWNALLARRHARIRFCETQIDGLADIYEVLDGSGILTFYAWDSAFERICVEATLCNFVGLAAQLHFSVHPDYMGKAALEICEETLQWMFSLRRMDEDQPLIKSLYGLTPITNRLAIKFVLNNKFEKLGILPSSVFDHAKGQYVDAMISMRTV